jgi:hypothetical protein
MDLFLTDNSMANGLLAITGIVGAFMLMIYTLMLPPPSLASPLDRHAEEKVQQIYTRHDLWRW